VQLQATDQHDLLAKAYCQNHQRKNLLKKVATTHKALTIVCTQAQDERPADLHMARLEPKYITTNICQ
jgi:hypothetical protein